MNLHKQASSMHNVASAADSEPSNYQSLIGFEQRMFHHYQSHNPSQEDLDQAQIDNQLLADWLVQDDDKNNLINHDEGNTVNSLIDQLKQKSNQRRQFQNNQRNMMASKVKTEQSDRDSTLLLTDNDGVSSGCNQRIIGHFTKSNIESGSYLISDRSDPPTQNATSKLDYDPVSN